MSIRLGHLHSIGSSEGDVMHLREYLISVGSIVPEFARGPTPCRYPDVDVHPVTGQRVLRQESWKFYSRCPI